MARLLRITAGLMLFLAIMAGLVWVLWIPSPQGSRYVFVTAFGAGYLQEPTGIALAGDEVLVADGRAGRIVAFDRQGHFRRAFGEDILNRPMNMTVAGDSLYVADYGHDRITVFGLDGTLRRHVGRPGRGPGEFDSPGGVAVGPDGDLYVADTYNHRVQRLRPDGRFVRQWGRTGVTGIRAGWFNYPTDVAVAADGTLFVADGYNDRVQVFAPDGRFLHKWGGPLALNVFGPFPGWFATVTGIALDGRGCVYVADFYNHRVQKFTPQGELRALFGGFGHGPARFDRPLALAVAEDGSVFVTDFGNHRIQQWRPRETNHEALSHR